MPQEHSIIFHLKNGNQQPLTDAYKLYRDEFVQWAVNRFHVRDDEAKDIFQDVMVVFYQNVTAGKLIELRSDLKTYLFSIGKYKLLNLQKKISRTVTFVNDELIKISVNPNQMNDEEEYNREVIQQNLKHLPEKDREVLRLYYEERADMKTIAEKLGYKNADVAKKKKYEAFKKLAVLVKKNLKLFMLV